MTGFLLDLLSDARFIARSRAAKEVVPVKGASATIRFYCDTMGMLANRTDLGLVLKLEGPGLPGWETWPGWPAVL